MKNIRASFKFFLFFTLTVLIIPLQSIVLVFTDGPLSYYFPLIWQKSVCFIFRIKVKVIGAPSQNSQTIFISNHLSYLDIPVIGSTIKASFVAKKDVESWPVFGFLSKLQQTAFISRSREDAAKEKDKLDQMLFDRKNLIIFAEGTSTDGKEVLPFKSSLFSIALQKNLSELLVQPVTIAMNSVDGKKVINPEDRDLYSWHINMDTPLAVHLWLFAKTTGAIITVDFHPPIRAHDFADRKALALACHKQVSNGLRKTG